MPYKDPVKRKEYQDQYRANNKEKKKEKAKDYYQENKEEYREKKRKYYEDNVDKIKDQTTLYREKIYQDAYESISSGAGSCCLIYIRLLPVISIYVI